MNSKNSKPKSKSKLQRDKSLQSQVPKNLTNDELIELHQWIDSIRFSRPKKNLARDFSDGVLVAETLKCFFPGKVNLKYFFTANSKNNKLVNWNYLNDKIFPKFGLKKLKQGALNKLMDAKPGAIEQLLFDMRSKLKEQNPAIGLSNISKSTSSIKNRSQKKASKLKRKSSRDILPPFSKIELQIAKEGFKESFNDEETDDFGLTGKVGTCEMSLGYTEIPRMGELIFNDDDNGNPKTVTVSYKNQSWDNFQDKTLYPFNARWYSYPINDSPALRLLEAVNTNGLV